MDSNETTADGRCYSTVKNKGTLEFIKGYATRYK